MMIRLYRFLIPHTETIFLCAILLLIGIISRSLFKMPPLWEYVTAGMLWLLLLIVSLLEIFDRL